MEGWEGAEIENRTNDSIKKHVEEVYSYSPWSLGQCMGVESI